ncbi:murein L,D-transpeptidase catalytic domain family protein [Flavobacterium pedocola]
MDSKKIKALDIASQEGQDKVLKELFEFAQNSKANFWGVVDFNKHSSEERFYIFDLENETFKKFLVAHGKNSGDDYAENFSNEIGSNCSSLGVYKTLSIFPSNHHGYALEIIGKEETNSNAQDREIIIHEADYVVPNYKGTGRAGRSEGCFAVNPLDIEEVMDCLKDGSYFIAWHE